MEAGKKRALLARMEGQLAAIDRSPSECDRRWQRINWALDALAGLPLDAREQALLTGLRHHVDAMLHDIEHGIPADVARHRRTIIRTDCVLWQMRLRRQTPTTDAAA